MNDFTRKNGESENDLIYRVASKKDEVGTWEDVARILNELLKEQRDESTYRKRYRTLENEKSGVSSGGSSSINSELEKIRLEKESLRKEKIKLQSLNLERNRIDRAEARQELFYEYVGNAIKVLNPPPKINLLYEEEPEVEYVMCIGDIHYGAVFEIEGNAYNPEVVKERFDYLFSKTVDFVQNKNVNKIHIVNLGDNIQGLLRVSDAKLNDSSLVKSVVEVSHLIASFLNELSAYVQIEYYHVPTSNHTQLRLLDVKPNEMPDEDVEYIVSHYIKDLLLNNKNVNVHLSEDGYQYMLIDINGYTVGAMHGHTVKDINSVLDQLSSYTGDMFDYLFLGHLHSGKELTVSAAATYDAEVIVCPSFVGTDPYSQRLMKSSCPAVKIYGFSPVSGHIETYKFVL